MYNHVSNVDKLSGASLAEKVLELADRLVRSLTHYLPLRAPLIYMEVLFIRTSFKNTFPSMRGERSSRRHLRLHCVLVAVQVSNLLRYFHSKFLMRLLRPSRLAMTVRIIFEIT